MTLNATGFERVLSILSRKNFMAYFSKLKLYTISNINNQH